MDPNTPVQAPQPIDPYYGAETAASPWKKILIIIGILFVVVFIVVAVIFFVTRANGGGSDKEVTLTYWGVWEDQSVMGPIIDDFQREHPNIKVQYQKQNIDDLNDYTLRLITRINEGKGPDIYRYHSSWIPQLKPVLLPFPQEVVESTELDTDYYDVVKADLKVNGAYYGVPLSIDTLALFVNTQLLSNVGVKPPTTWEDLISSAKKLTVIEDGKIITSGVALGTYDNIAHAPDIVSLLFKQNRADIENLAGPTITNSEDALTFYTAFANGQDRVWDPTLDNSKLAFIKGNLAMYFGYSWDIFEIKGQNPNLPFEVVKVPKLSGRDETTASYWVEGVSSKTKYSKESFLFLEYLSQPATLQKIYSLQAKTRLFGILYPRKSMAGLLSSNKLIYPFLEQANKASSSPFASDTFDGKDGINTRVNVYLQKAVGSINDGGSVSSAVETLGQGVTQVLSQYGE